MEWHPSVEVLLQKYADESVVREILHRRAFYYYKRKLTCIQLPIIILSVMSGSLQFLSKGYTEYESTLVTITGGVSLFVGILSSVMTYLKLGESKKENQLAATEWMNFYNHIRYQLSLARELRDDPQKFLEDVKQNYQRLYEISPMVNKSFITQVKKRVKRNADPEFNVPMYLNGLHHTHVWEDEYENNTD